MYTGGSQETSKCSQIQLVVAQDREIALPLIASLKRYCSTLEGQKFQFITNQVTF